MAILIAFFTTLGVLSGAFGPASAQLPPVGQSVFDALNEVLGLNWWAHGHVVQHREATLVLRGLDQRVYTINTAGLDAGALGRLKDGRPVTVELKRATRLDAMPIAASVAAIQAPTKTFRRVDGTVEAVSDERIAFKTREGRVLTLDRARIVGEAPQVDVNETATLIYEQEPTVAGVWIDTRETQPSALSGPAGR
jgi:hypothetical protein